MVALASLPTSCPPRPIRRSHRETDRFLLLLPGIRRAAKFAFRRWPAVERAEAVQEVIASTFVAYAHLQRQGREEIARATPLARYAIAQFRSGRRVARRLNIKDVTSEYCRERKGVALDSLWQLNDRGHWEELLVEDRRATPADIVAARLDFKAWLRRLPSIKRRAARLLAGGASTSDAAVELRVTRARVSQLRRELQQSWEQFHSESLRPVLSAA